MEEPETERREVKRRYTYDRRSDEKRKQFWREKLLPILIGLTATSLISWGVYITHLSYTINAKYEEIFLKYVAEQQLKEATADHRREIHDREFNAKLLAIRAELNTGLVEMRNAMQNLYNLLLRRQQTEEEDKDKENF